MSRPSMLVDLHIEKSATAPREHESRLIFHFQIQTDSRILSISARTPEQAGQNIFKNTFSNPTHENEGHIRPKRKVFLFSKYHFYLRFDLASELVPLSRHYSHGGRCTAYQKLQQAKLSAVMSCHIMVKNPHCLPVATQFLICRLSGA